MLILDFFNEREAGKKQKRKIFRKKDIEKNNGLKRNSINVNGRNVIVLEITEKDLKKEDVLTLLKIYKGRVLIPEKYRETDMLTEYLYSPKEYYQRAILSSFANQIKSINKEWKNIVIKTDSFTPFREFYEIVRLSKKVTLITGANTNTEKFLNDCYYEYGAIVYLKKEFALTVINDVYLDLDKIEPNGKLMINVNGKDFLLYPDTTYFENQPEYQKLVQYNIDQNLICSAFSDK